MTSRSSSALRKSTAQRKSTARKSAKSSSGLPEWNLADLYAGIDAPEVTRDLQRMDAECVAFETDYKGRLAERIAGEVPAKVTLLPSNDPRSYAVCSDRLLATGFAPKRNVTRAIQEIAAAYREGRLKDDDLWYNVKWMKQHQLG